MRNSDMVMLELSAVWRANHIAVLAGRKPDTIRENELKKEHRELKMRELTKDADKNAELPDRRLRVRNGMTEFQGRHHREMRQTLRTRLGQIQ